VTFSLCTVERDFRLVKFYALEGNKVKLNYLEFPLELYGDSLVWLVFIGVQLYKIFQLLLSISMCHFSGRFVGLFLSFLLNHVTEIKLLRISNNKVRISNKFPRQNIKSKITV
jgi:hypothetical protein